MWTIRAGAFFLVRFPSLHEKGWGERPSATSLATLASMRRRISRELADCARPIWRNTTPAERLLRQLWPFDCGRALLLMTNAVADSIRPVRAGKLRNCLRALLLLAMAPAPASADPINLGPIYLRLDAAPKDRAGGISIIVDTRGLLDGTVYLCSTLASPFKGKRRQIIIRDELMAKGVPERLIQFGGRYSRLTRNPQVRLTSGDFVVAFVGAPGEDSETLATSTESY